MAEQVQPAEAAPESRWTPLEIFWLVVLVVSVIVGFGMTIFAPV
jgi:hypothetical protein